MSATAAEDVVIGSHPDANVLIEGFRTPLIRNGENAEALGAARDATLRAFSPRNAWQLWLSDDIAFMTVRMDRIGRMDRRQRDQSALRAEFFWEDDRRLLAVELGDRLRFKPEKTVTKLKATPQGCDWLLGRWGWLQAVLDGGKTWDDAQRSIAFDLLGVGPEFREAMAGRLADPSRLVRDEVAALNALRSRVAESDALERSMAMADMIDPATAEYRSLKQFERRTHRRIKWAMAMLELIPKYVDADPGILESRGLKQQHAIDRMADAVETAKVAAGQAEARANQLADALAAAEAKNAALATALTEATRTEPTLPQPWANPKTPTAPTPDLPPLPTPTRRPDPAKLRAKTRSNAARQRREDRPDR